MTETMSQRTYRVYLDFLETAEKKRRWNIFDDIPWDKLDTARACDATARRIELYCSGRALHT